MTPTPNRPARPRTAATPVVTGRGAVDEGVEPQPVTAVQAERIAPFVARMATQELGESTRRAHREAVEAFWTWCTSDAGPAAGRRHRYERHLDRNAPHLLAPAGDGLDRYAQYRELVARTLPIDL